ncbi:hypothetical protein Hokovirus_1_97 [Hokovirus HKV1]|uniref:Uncharacterized protein n=1 Tax=Hokovirus HKV1 TaxID=1977638 RepID=A0A1V0SF04_9VIRU|nr:hypothetical protein Hokovirus_1_97 [Hokovirus HKV1]
MEILPNLINPDDYLEKIIDQNTFSEKITNYLLSLYNSYIKKYIFLIVLFILLIIYLIHRYYENLEIKKKYRDENSKEYKIMRNIYSIISEDNTNSEYLTFT